MARHRDLNRASSLLEGSQGWIIENHPEAATDPNKRKHSVLKRNVLIIKMGFVIMLIHHVWELTVVLILKREVTNES